VTRSNSELISKMMSPFRHIGRTPFMGISPSQGVYLHKTAHHIKMHTYVHA